MKKYIFFSVLIVALSFSLSAQNKADEPAGKGFSATSFESAEKINLTIFPNPATDYLKVTMQSSVQEDITIRLSDNIGNPVAIFPQRLDIGVNQFVLDLSSSKIRSGIYFLQIQTSSGIKAKKLIINK